MRPPRAGPVRAAARLWGRLWGRLWVWLLLPWLLVLAVAVVEVTGGLQGRVVHAGPLLSPVPALAAIRGRPRDVLAVSAAALAVGLAAAPGPDMVGADNSPTALASLAVVSVASLVAAVARQRREGQLVRIRRVAEAAQLALLSPVPRRAGGLRLAARYSAAESDTLIGGDLYEVVVRPDRTRLIIGDVRGKGLPAVRTAAAVLGAFREAAHYESALTTVAGRCSRAVARCAREMGSGDGDGAEGDELFVTAALVEVQGRELRVVDLGHPPPLLLTPDDCVPLAVEPLPPLGLVHGFTVGWDDDCGLTVHTRWRPGDRLLLYTDGIDEARDENGRFFPLTGALEELREVPTERLPDELLEAVARHTGRSLRDDAAVVAVEFVEAEVEVGEETGEEVGEGAGGIGVEAGEETGEEGEPGGAGETGEAPRRETGRRRPDGIGEPGKAAPSGSHTGPGERPTP
ncbi:PP2C family protein-serine/threonine phosphatase [Streptomyces sp. DH37]|uniref:PP2C family protein-serine/threonine phosphatase n=1 Tax=Streptomyces sp. DH37 TaxID=3040122 RepID=UPI0024411844|nr:PP2C family protein-serine/threonine phosphatase [Streptomyces sp. DH37]MDG9702478.1 PP2C family protein-serine/threonine phosphatase [Streptomyces sp. DH37]